MTTPVARLPLRYGHDRSLVDGTRIRWGGFGDIALGALLAMSNPNAAGIIAGALFAVLGIATWAVSGFGTIDYRTLSPLARAVVVLGAIGFIALVVFVAVWNVTIKIIKLVTSHV